MKKSSSRNKLLMCFKPDVIDMDHLVLESNIIRSDRKPKRSDDAAIRKREKSQTVKDSPMNSVIVHSQGKQSFSRVIKAVFFETILVKRIQDNKGRSGEDSSKSKRKPSSGSKRIQSTNDHEIHDHRTILNYSSSSSSSQSSSLESEFGNKPRENNSQKQNQEAENKNQNLWSLYVLLIVSLTGTIFWGKAYAILFTSTWLYLITPRKKWKENEQFELRLILMPEDSRTEYNSSCNKESKKKVVMEGLLARNSHYLQKS